MLIVSQDGIRVINAQTFDEMYIERSDNGEFHIHASHLPEYLSAHKSESEAKRKLRELLDAYAADCKVFYMGEENK